MNPIRTIVLTLLKNGWSDRSTSDKGKALREQVETRAACGDLWAQAECERALNDHFRRRFSTEAKAAQRSAVQYAYNGTVINGSVPKRYAVAIRGEDGTKSGGYQLPMWLDLSHDQFRELIGSQREQRNRLTASIVTLEFIERQWSERYPDAESAAEVCALAGIDPDSIVIEVA